MLATRAHIVPAIRQALPTAIHITNSGDTVGVTGTRAREITQSTSLSFTEHRLIPLTVGVAAGTAAIHACTAVLINIAELALEARGAVGTTAVHIGFFTVTQTITAGTRSTNAFNAISGFTIKFGRARLSIWTWCTRASAVDPGF